MTNKVKTKKVINTKKSTTLPTKSAKKVLGILSKNKIKALKEHIKIVKKEW